VLISASATASGGTFLSWGIFGIQVGNLIVIVAMLVLFLVALVAPFPGGRRSE
jgi:hypothetical protein